MNPVLAHVKPISNADLWRIEQKSLKDTLKWWNYVRWLSTISFLSVGIVQMAISRVNFPVHAFVLTLIGTTLLNIVYTVWIEYYDTNHIYPFIHNFLDIIIFSLAIYVTGGLKSPFIWSYLIPILTSSITIGRMAGLLACFGSLVSFFSVIVFDSYRNLATAVQFTEYIKHMSEINTHNLLSYTCLFLLVYFISSFLSNTLRDQNKSLAELNNLLNTKNQQLLLSQEKILQMERKATIDRMARTIQHELNNPLAIMALNTELIMKEKGNASLSRLQPIRVAVIRMKKILAKIEKLYSYSYKEALEDIKILDLYQTENLSKATEQLENF
jgi:signal transduction histidine kinase